jgi:stage V sporulation protein B
LWAFDVLRISARAHPKICQLGRSDAIRTAVPAVPSPSTSPVNATDPKRASQPDAARTAGRGGLAVLSAKVFFIFTGLLQQTLLPWIIGRDGYGALARVLAAANIVNNVVVNSSIQGVSHTVAHTPEPRAREALRRVVRTHSMLAVPIALGFFFFAPVYARFQGAEHIVLPLRVVSLVVLMYALYAPLIGYLNGRRRFSWQAGLDATYATLRTAGLIGVGWLLSRTGQGVLGACIGFSLAACIIFPTALRVTGLGQAGDAGPTIRQHLTFVGPVALGQVAIQLLMQSDIVLLGHFASGLVGAQGLSGVGATKAADEMVGAYRACQLFAFLPFQLLTSITFILFPMLAKAKADQDREAIARYVRTGVRLSLVFASVMVATVAGLGPHLLRLVYPVEFAQMGGQALRVLALGQGAFAIFYVETTALTSLGRERVSAALTWLAVVLIVGLCWAAGMTSSAGPQLLVRVAGATTAALAITCVVGAVSVRQASGAFASPLTIVRVVAALAVTVLIAMHAPWLGKLMVLPEAAAAALCAVGVLLLSREVGSADLAMIKNVLRRRAS